MEYTLKIGDTVVLRNGMQGKIACPGFSKFIAIKGFKNIYLRNHLRDMYTPDLNHKDDKSLDVIILNGKKIKKTPLKEKIQEMVKIAEALGL